MQTGKKIILILMAVSILVVTLVVGIAGAAPA